MNGLFITGTDTGIGKTVLAALLLAELRRRGLHAAPMKPVQTGCTPDTVPDLDYALSMASMKVDNDTYRSMAPYRFEPACSPHLAAEQADTEVDIAEMVIAARTLASAYEYVIAEGAGGCVVPLNRRETTLDLIQALRLPVLLAARPGLGTINHTLLSLRALRSDGIPVAGIVFITCTSAASGFIEKDNITTIEQFGKVPVLGTIPYCEQLATPDPAYADLPSTVIEEVEKIVSRLTE